MKSPDIKRAIDAVWRMESARLIAALTRIVRDVGLAEDLAQDALVAALEHWPKSGVPDNPGAWFMTAAKRRAIDLLRRQKVLERKVAELGRDAEAVTEPDFDAAVGDAVEDDVLRLIFMACHPVLSAEARVALTLRLMGGLTTGEIARAFLVPEATVAQRIVRSKRTLAAARVPFEVPEASERAARLSSVLEVIYLVLNEGYSATTGDDWVRPSLCDEALRLGRILAELTPRDPEVHGLVALMELQASRLRARVSPAGVPILLAVNGRSGTGCSFTAAWWPWSVPTDSEERWAGTRSRLPLPPATRGPAPPRKLTGRASRPSMTHWPRSRRPPLWSSTEPSPWPWRLGRRRASSSLMRSVPNCHSRAITCCPACAATSW